MNDPQIWSMVGLTVAFTATTLGTQCSNYRRLARMLLELDRSLSAKLDGFGSGSSVRLEGLGQSVNARIDGLAADVGHRLDNVERDLTLIKGHLLEQQRS